MKIDYQHFNFKEKSKEKEFFLNWAFVNNLFSDAHQNSRMRKIYLGERMTKDILVVIAFNDKFPIAITICENKDMVISLNENLEKNTLDAKVAIAGFLSFYVKKEYRSNGIAKELLSRVENERVSQIKHELTGISGDIYLGFLAAEKAVPLIMKSSVHAHPFDIREDPDDVIEMIKNNISKKEPIVKMVDLHRNIKLG